MNEKMYTDKNDKVKVIIESYGDMFRLTLEPGQNGTSHTMFANLAWTCHLKHRDNVPDNEELECFMAPKNKVINVIKAYREVNPKQEREGQKQSPFIFKWIGQERKFYKDLDVTPYRFRKPSFESINLKEEA
jgi:hypothetical protein